MPLHKMLEENIKPGGSVKEKSGASVSAVRCVGPPSFHVTVVMAEEPSLVCHPGRTVGETPWRRKNAQQGSSLGQSFTAWNQKRLS